MNTVKIKVNFFIWLGSVCHLMMILLQLIATLAPTILSASSNEDANVCHTILFIFIFYFNSFFSLWLRICKMGNASSLLLVLSTPR